MRVALAMMLILALTGCGTAEEPAGPGDTTTGGATGAEATSPPEAATPREATAPASTAAPESTGTSTVQALPADSIEGKAAQALAQKLGIGADKLQLTAKEPQEWSDSSLGCPAPDMMYLQVITPGFKLTFSDGTKTYEVHTDERGSHFVLCENKQPVSLEGS